VEDIIECVFGLDRVSQDMSCAACTATVPTGTPAITLHTARLLPLCWDCLHILARLSVQHEGRRLMQNRDATPQGRLFLTRVSDGLKRL
jgi:hypothetical protein